MLKWVLLLLVFSQQTFAQSLHLQNIPAQTDASFRGLSVVDDSTAWVSGTKGWIGTTTDGGTAWVFKQVKGFEQCDFRSLYAFNSTTAIVANAGSPAYILLTTDAGINWTQVYKNTDSAAFFDGICFWNNKEGIIYGDPIARRMLMLRTNDGGKTWLELPLSNRPLLDAQEISFAASGTCIRCLGNNKVLIATGGKISGLLVSTNKGTSWQAYPAPILQGEGTTGIFSFAYANDKDAVIVGGDYKKDTLRKDHVFYTTDGGQHWLAPSLPTGGYRECVEYINTKTVIATGPAGTDISYDGGRNWQQFSDERLYHVIRKSRKGNLIIMAGGAGKISLLKQ